MKNLVKFLSVFWLLAVLLACTDKKDPQPAPAKADPVTPVTPLTPVTPAEKATIVYIVRHGEKGTNSATDPDLSAAGQARALTLRDSLQNDSLAAIYTTNYKRTRQTVAPTASAKNLTPIVYTPTIPAGLNALATKILNENLNKKVLIVGHSNTVLETIEALGATRPIAEVTDNDYNYFFKVTLKQNKTPVVEVKRYGN